MVYNFLGIDEKTQRNLLTLDQNIRTVYLNVQRIQAKTMLLPTLSNKNDQIR